LHLNILLVTAQCAHGGQEENLHTQPQKTTTHLPHHPNPYTQNSPIPSSFSNSSITSCFSNSSTMLQASNHFTIPAVISSPAISINKGMEGYRVAVLVLSGPENFAKREKLRRNLVMPGVHLNFFFLIGRSPRNSTLDQLVKQESIRWNDILYLEMAESYKNLPMKTLAGLDFVLQKMGWHDLLLKIDDDLEISGEKLSRALLEENPWNPNTLYCFPLTRVPPHRQTWGRNAKMFVSRSTYPADVFPDYCLGWLVAMTPQTAALLLTKVESAPAVHIDDVYITGILRQGTNVTLSMLSANPFFHTSIFKDVFAKCRLLSWAAHVFAYDLAFEPEDWPWRPIAFLVEHTWEQAFSEISDSEPNSVTCLSSFLLQHVFFVIVFINLFQLLCHFAFLRWL